MKVLSLFDGISTCMYVLEKLGINVEKYYSSEIEENALAISQYHYGDKITYLGDIEKLTEVAFSKYNGSNMDEIVNIDNPILDELKDVDLITWGSPCVDFSIIKNDRLGLKGEGSRLYLNALYIWKYIKPKYFFMENVKMTQDWEGIITKDLGVKPVFIDSKIISGANRPRLYWTNIPAPDYSLVNQNKKLKDFCQNENEVDKKYWYNVPFDYISDTNDIQCIMNLNCHEMSRRVYNLNGYCGTLTAVSGGYQEKKVYQNGRCRKLTPIEYERLQMLPDDYTKWGIKNGEKKKIADSKRYSVCGNGWTVGIIEYLFSKLK